MKRLTIFLFIAVLLIGSINAQQNRETRQRENNPVTVEGTLKLDRGYAAVESGDTVYYVPILTRFMGFISELTEGATVSVEGYGFRNVIVPVNVTIAGKSYDFTSLRTPAFGQNNNPRNPPKAYNAPRPNQPQMRDTPRFNQPDRNSFRNSPGINSCSCNCSRRR